jgi:hypothetical protein
MNWLRPAVFFALMLPASLLHACSGDDSSNSVINYDASQTPIPKIEAGAPCTTNNDCADGLSCLYPATTCEAFRVCTPTPPNPCPSPQPACSCLAETTQVCNGYASDPIDSMGACGDGGVVIIPEAGGGETGAVDAADSSMPVDSGDANSE